MHGNDEISVRRINSKINRNRSKENLSSGRLPGIPVLVPWTFELVIEGCDVLIEVLLEVLL